MKFIELESERLIYRKFNEDDFPIVFDWLNNAENMKYWSGEPRNESETRNYLHWAISTTEAEDRHNYEFAVVLKTDSSLIGSASLINLPDKPEIGWHIHRNYWKQGYGTEIGKTMLKFGFDVLGLRRIIAACNSGNRGSYRIMEKIGMRREAHFIKALQANSILNYEWCDMYQYAILAEEYYKYYETNTRQIY